MAPYAGDASEDRGTLFGGPFKGDSLLLFGAEKGYPYCRKFLGSL